MRSLDRGIRRFGLVAVALLPLTAAAYSLSGLRWSGSTVVMHLQLGSSGTLLDGSTSWGAVAEDALATWNNNLTNVKFSVVRDSIAPRGRSNSYNNVFWSPTVYGDAWDSRTLAIALSNYDTRTHYYTETDVLFNDTLSWNSYRGPLKTATSGGTLHDFRRVALHEFGHALGLNHPDDIGQSVSAVMNTTTSNIDNLTADDIAGGRAIYDAAGAVVASQLVFQGSIGYSTLGNNLTLTAANVANVGNATSGAVRMELWAMPQHFSDGVPTGSHSLGNYTFSSVLQAGFSFPNVSANTTYTAPSAAGSYYVAILLTEFTGGSGSGYTIRDWREFGNQLTVASSIATQPTSRAASPGGSVTFTTGATDGPTPLYQWQFNGADVTGATGSSLAVANIQPASAGLYVAVATRNGTTSTSDAAILGVTTTGKVIGTGEEIAPDIKHPNGNIFDQVLINGVAATITADAGQATRMSYIDLNNDIVQVEFSGSGALSLVLDNPSGPAAPLNYNQSVTYMKGHGGIVITGADETTNVGVFSVGARTAVNPALFKETVTYNGIADVAFIAISSRNGQFGGLRTANTSYNATKGLTGVYAPGVQFTGPVFIGDIDAGGTATPVILLGSADNVQINGGNLLQSNGQPVKVSGVGQLKFVANTNSHGVAQPAQTNKAVLRQNGVDVTAQIVVNPGP